MAVGDCEGCKIIPRTGLSFFCCCHWWCPWRGKDEIDIGYLELNWEL